MIDEFKSKITYLFLKTLPKNSVEDFDTSIELIASIFLDKGYQEAITIIPLGSKYMNEVNIFANKFCDALTGKEIIISTIPMQTISTPKKILLVTPGMSTKKELKLKKKELNFQVDSVLGWILFDPTIKI